MANYSKSTNFAVKDSLTTGDPNKIVSGVEIDTEFNNIASGFSSVDAAFNNLDFSASNIDYSNTSSGFTATDMQAAFDEVTDNPYVVQTITADTDTLVTVSTDTYTDIGLSVSITPKFDNSKIVVMASIHQDQFRNNDSVQARLRLQGNGTEKSTLLIADDRSTGDIRDYTFPVPYYFVETISSTDEITYNFQGKSEKTSNDGLLEFNQGGSFSTVVVMEIKQ